jgi:pyrroloquinoline quinone (PQQ) biosynthesis protein C
MTVEQVLGEASKDIVKHPFLRRLENGNISREEWRYFWIPRHQITAMFTPLLLAAMDAAETHGDDELSAALQKNLEDELGIVDGRYNAQKAHRTWRRDFYRALGISDQQIQDDDYNCVDFYVKDVMKMIREHPTPAFLGGAVLFFEYHIPREFAKLRRGRDAIFAEKFIDHGEDNAAMREEKHRARLYLDDHVLHDAGDHYPTLLRALQKYDSNEDLRKGIRQMAEIKCEFYDYFDPG